MVVSGAHRAAVIGWAMVGSSYLMMLSGFPEVSGKGVKNQAHEGKKLPGWGHL